MTEQEFNDLTERETTITTSQVIIEFQDLRFLADIAREQMLFPAWKRADLGRANRVSALLHSLKLLEEERLQRCAQYAKAMSAKIAAEESELPPACSPKLTIVPSGED
jgi:hypothetical protein